MFKIIKVMLIPACTKRQVYIEQSSNSDNIHKGNESYKRRKCDKFNEIREMNLITRFTIVTIRATKFMAVKTKEMSK